MAGARRDIGLCFRAVNQSSHRRGSPRFIRLPGLGNPGLIVHALLGPPPRRTRVVQRYSTETEHEAPQPPNYHPDPNHSRASARVIYPVCSASQSLCRLPGPSRFLCGGEGCRGCAYARGEPKKSIACVCFSLARVFAGGDEAGGLVRHRVLLQQEEDPRPGRSAVVGRPPCPGLFFPPSPALVVCVAPPSIGQPHVAHAFCTSGSVVDF